MSAAPPPAELERAARTVAQEAAELVHKVVGRAAALKTKSTSTDIVTPTDLRSEQHIRRRLDALVPGSSYVGEEYPRRSGSSGVTWVIDPIDGTVNFLYDLPVVAVSVAAELDGVVVAGAVSDVLRGEVFSAARGHGAGNGDHPVAPTGIGELGDALVGTGYSYRAATRVEQADVVSRVLPAARDIRSFGSAALQMCWVACGRLDAYYERDLKPWDLAAGAFIASEAGARVEFPGDDNGDLTVVTTPGVFDALRALL
ncbi:MAG: inositol monophosphatase [Ilumatobacter sp.]|nr:inositol monophosphatase [Ilumatobacter sp.]